MHTSDVDMYLKSIKNFNTLAHLSLCEYCEHAYLVPGNTCYCTLKNDLVFSKRSCPDVALDMRVLDNRKMMCRICANNDWKYHPDYKLYSVNCSKGLDPDSCITRHFEFKEEVK